MATDQGKTSNVAGLAIMAAVSGKSIPETGTTIYRPPYVPVAIGAFAGHHRDENFHSVRLTPSHHWAAEQGAVFVDTGLWKRAQWYPQPGEKDWLESVTREVKAVRGGVGFCDVSTLGKIDVHGPDAGAFLDRVYINTFSNLAVGKARYGLMLREDGLVYDDGTTSRLADDHYFLTTTTAKAGLVMQHLEFCRQVLFPELDVQLTSVSDQWAQFSIAGPKTRDLLREIVDPAEDLSNEGFPFMGAREVALRGGIKARLFRISFSGEMAFEISVPARYGEALVRNLMSAGKPFGVTPYGTEALGVMRVEKGHVAGPELNGTTTAADLGLGKMMSTKKDFIGRVMAGREALVAPDRQVVVGIKPVDRDAPPALRRAHHSEGQDARPGHRPGLCHLGLLLADARPVDRARARRARPRTHRRDRRRARSAARRGLRGRALQSRLLRSGWRAPAWLSFPGPPAVRWSRRSSSALMARARRCRRLADRNPQFRPGPGDGAARRVRLIWPMPRRRASASRRRRHRRRCRRGRDADLVGAGPVFRAVEGDGKPSMEALRQAFSGLASLSDQSHARVLIRIAGPQARAMLAKLSSIDLHPAAFPLGAAAATSIDHTSVNLWRGSDLPDGQAVFNLLVFATFAESLWHTMLGCRAPEYGVDDRGIPRNWRFPDRFRHALDLSVLRRNFRDRLGHRPEIHQRLHAAGSDRADVASMIVSLGLLGLALKALPVGTAYAVWTGIGTVGTALLGIYLLGEPATAIRLGCIGLIVAGIIGLKLATSLPRLAKRDPAAILAAKIISHTGKLVSRTTGLR